MEAGNGVSTVIRVRLFGPLEVERRLPNGSWQVTRKEEWSLGTPPRSVLKRLLTTPGRRLSRSDIEDDLWPDASMELADRNLSNALMVIRRIIGKDLVETVGPLCGLADQAQIWTDFDACVALLKEAENHGCFTREARPFLEEASSYFERGKCLEDESERWCHAVRADAERLQRQCYLWLAKAYETAGKLWQAGQIYRAITRAWPGDEDALWAWIEMLVCCGKRREAMVCYQESKDLWEAQGFALTKSFEQIAASIERPAVKRREITKGLGILVGGLLLTDRQPSRFAPGQLLHSEEMFSICSATIPVLWRLYFEGHLSEVQALLPECLSQLSLLVQNPGYQKAAARLASQACQLAALIEKHLYNSGNALLYAKQGEEYGQVAEDLNLQIAALIQQGNIYWDLGQAWRELEAYQKAYQLTQEFKQKREISPLLLGRVSVGLAKSYGKFADQKQQALRFLGEAYERYPERPEADLAFSYTYHTRFTLFNHAGLTYLHIGQPEEALRTFESLSVPAELVPRRLEFLIRLSMTSLALGNLEQAVEQTALAATSARMLGSDLRYHEAYKLYEQMLEQWPQEAQVKALAEHFR